MEANPPPDSKRARRQEEDEQEDPQRPRLGCVLDPEQAPPVDARTGIAPCQVDLELRVRAPGRVLLCHAPVLVTACDRLHEPPVTGDRLKRRRPRDLVRVLEARVAVAAAAL